MMPALSGPSRPPASGGKPRRLVILLHGLGADGNDLIGLAPYWAPLLPNAEFLSPNAPFPCDVAPYGYQWYSSQDRTPEAAFAGVRVAAPILDAFIDEALAERGLDDSELALVGFSQGYGDVSLCRVPARQAGRRHCRLFGQAAGPRAAGERAALASAYAPCSRH